MEPVSALQDLKQRAFEARNQGRSGHELQRLDEILLGMAEGLYPVCATCGERIEMERLLRDPAELQCWSCVVHGPRAPSP